MYSLEYCASFGKYNLILVGSLRNVRDYLIKRKELSYSARAFKVKGWKEGEVKSEIDGNACGNDWTYFLSLIG
jgi:hypothetical protein